MNKQIEKIELDEAYITLKEAAALTGKSPSALRNYIADGYLPVYKMDGINAICKKELQEFLTTISHESLFGYMVLEDGDSLKPLDSFNGIPNLSDPTEYETSHAYLVSRFGRIFNISTCRELKQSNATHDYKQVGLNSNGKQFYARVHRLVAFVWCENGKNKAEVHHIDGIRTNNRAENLIFLTPEEHDKADRMLKEAKATGKFEEYNAFIAEMQEDNRCTEKTYTLLDMRDEDFLYYLYVSYQTYAAIQNGKYDRSQIPFSEIRGEYALRIGKNEEVYTG